MDIAIATVALGLSILNSFVLVLVLREFGALRAYRDSRGLQLGAPIPEFRVRTLGGSTVTSADLRRTVLLFISKGCDACQMLVRQLQAAGHAQSKLMIAVVTSETLAPDDAFLSGLRFFEPSQVFIDDDRRIYQRFQVANTPFALAIDDVGTVRGRRIPEHPNDLQHLIESVA